MKLYSQLKITMKPQIEYIAILFLRTVLKLFHIFPLHNNRVVFFSFNGKQYSCSPRRISEYLLSNYSGKYEIIWALRRPKNYSEIIPENVKIVRYRTLKYYYYVKTAKFLVINARGYGEISRRKNQYFIQTWHASNGYKNIGNYSTTIERKLYLLGHRDYSYVTCGSRNMEEKRVHISMNYWGNIIKGTPRMDLMFSSDLKSIKNKVRTWFHLYAERKIVLYAPTWRSDRNISYYGMEYEKLKQALTKKFGGEWVILVRLHPNVYKQIQIKEAEASFIKEATSYPDMEELLCVADVLISDYSSCIWDYSFMYNPCFLFCPDIIEYGGKSGFDIPIKEIGMPFSTTMEELEKNILDFDQNQFNQSMMRHHEDMGSYEDGRATERVCQIISCLTGVTDEII